VFTPRLGDNHFRIEGCGFGTVRGEVILNVDSNIPASAPSRSIPLQLDGSAAWSENEIDVRLDPHVAGLLDSPATLVVRFINGTRIQFPCRFVAARGEPIALSTIPASWVKLDATASSFGPIRQLEYSSPPLGGEAGPREAAHASALVVRSDSNTFASGSDTYDLSGLTFGWSVESVQLQKYSAGCPGDVMSSRQSGNWNATFNAQGSTINWPVDECSSFIPPMFRFALSSSQYGLKVWVVGPIGTQPLRADFVRDITKKKQLSLTK
jgi:hypothetical protein